MSRMCQLLVLVGLACLVTSVSAEIYSWKDEPGRTVISDKPPPGKVKAEKVTKGGGEAPPPAASEAAAKPGVDPELEKRRKLASEREAAAKKQQEASFNTEKKAGCDDLRRYLRLLESGERIVKGDPQGERYYVEDDERARDIATTRQRLTECN